MSSSKNRRSSGISPEWSRRLLEVLGVFVVAVIFYGCDTLTEGDALVLQPKEVTFRFEFSSSGLTPGEAISVASVQSVDLAAALANDGYEKDEVVSAQVSSAELRRVNPLSFSLSSLSDFSVSLAAGGSSAATVASLESLPDGNSVTLGLGPTRNIETLVRQPSFSAVAEFVPGQLPDEDYVLTVTLEIRIEVESL